jgi:3-oxoacyl-[acyl-carrier protein] reductase
MRSERGGNVRLSEKVAVVTGSASGIGRGIALKFAEHGAKVVANDLSFMAAESVSEKINDSGGEAIPVQADVSSREDIEKMFDEVMNTFGRVDILVSNAGVRKDSLIHNLTESQWDEVINVQLKGCFNCVKQAQQYMVRQSYGKIVIIASPIPPGLGGPGQSNYSAANAGLIGLTTSLAIELGGYNINVNCIAPDFIETKMTRESIRSEGMYLDDFKKAALALIPLRRLGTVEDVSNAAVFLASDESSYISGQVQGGTVMHDLPDTEDADAAAERYWPEEYKDLIRTHLKQAFLTQFHEAEAFTAVYEQNYSNRFSSYDQFVDRLAEMIAIGAENGVDDVLEEVYASFRRNTPIPDKRHQAVYLWPEPLAGDLKQQLHGKVFEEFRNHHTYEHIHEDHYQTDLSFDDFIDQIAALVVVGAANGADDSLGKVYRSFLSAAPLPPARRRSRRIR